MFMFHNLIFFQISIIHFQTSIFKNIYFHFNTYKIICTCSQHNGQIIMVFEVLISFVCQYTQKLHNYAHHIHIFGGICVKNQDGVQIYLQLLPWTISEKMLILKCGQPYLRYIRYGNIKIPMNIFFGSIEADFKSPNVQFPLHSFSHNFSTTAEIIYHNISEIANNTMHIKSLPDWSR